MSRSMQRDSYESLIKQIVYIEENMKEICSDAVMTGFFTSEAAAGEYFEEYIGKVESLFKDLRIVEKESFRYGAKNNGLPFITLGSNFTLTDGDNRSFCHLSREIPPGGKGPVRQLYFLSQAGLKLLLKEQGESVETDIGEGLSRYNVGSITIE